GGQGEAEWSAWLEGDDGAGLEVLATDIAECDGLAERERSHRGGDAPNVLIAGHHRCAGGRHVVALEHESGKAAVDVPPVLDAGHGLLADVAAFAVADERLEPRLREDHRVVDIAIIPGDPRLDAQDLPRRPTPRHGAGPAQGLPERRGVLGCRPAVETGGDRI